VNRLILAASVLNMVAAVKKMGILLNLFYEGRGALSNALSLSLVVLKNLAICCLCWCGVDLG